MARSYRRDSRGRFSSGGGGGGRRGGGASGGAGGSGGRGGASSGGRKKKAAAEPPAMKKPPLPPPMKKPPLPPPPKAATGKGANAIKPSPRSSEARSIPFTASAKSGKGKPLTSAEKAYVEIKAQKSKFRSDKKVREEMMRRGFLKGKDPQGMLMTIGRSARIKQGKASPWD